MKKISKIAIIILLIIGAAIIYLTFKHHLLRNDQIPLSQKLRNIIFRQPKQPPMKIGSKGGSSVGNEPATKKRIEEEEQIPEDIYKRECGFYYDKYGICAGTCPDGTCTAEGESCYCKK